MRKLWTVLLITVTGCALGGQVSLASAAEFRDTTSPDSLSLVGTSPEQILIIGSNVTYECTTLNGAGVATTFPNTTLSFAPSYSGCKAKVAGVLVAKITVTNNGCQFTYSTAGTVTVSCEVGKSIVIEASTCTLKIGTQKAALFSVTYGTVAAGVQAVGNVSGIEQTNNCSASGEVTYKGTGVAKSATGGTVSFS